MTASREREVVDAFVSLASRVARGDDVIDLVTELAADSAHLLDIASAGLLLADRDGVLHLLAASSEEIHALELFQLQRDQGPCLDCYRSAKPVTTEDLRDAGERWPEFTVAAEAAGFRSVHALPMRFGDTTIGTLGLFNTTAGALTEEDLRLGQALADVASVSVVQSRAADDRQELNDQLQLALDSRIAIEQAKGLLAQLGELTMEGAFGALRTYSRDRNERLSEVARALSARELSAREVLHHVAARKASGPAKPRRVAPEPTS